MDTLAEVADATEQGIQPVCKHQDLVIGFLAHTGLSLDPMNRQPNPRNPNNGSLLIRVGCRGAADGQRPRH